MLSFAASLQKKPFGTTRKQTLLHGTVKYAISDVYVSFWTHLRSNLTLESSGKTSLIFRRQLRGLNTLDPTTKNQKAKSSKIVLHIYKQTNTHLNTDIVQLIVGEFFFVAQSCE